MSVKTHTFNGTKYKIDISDPIDGMCDHPKNIGKPELRVFADLTTKKGMESLFHEMLHASCWSASEEKVTRTAKECIDLAWRLGFRFIGDK